MCSVKDKLILFLLGFLIVFPFAAAAAETAAPNYAEDVRCWTEEVCTVDANSDGTPDGRFDKDSDEAKEACGGTTYGFCYPPALDYELSVALPITGTITTKVSGLGDYIDKIYKYLLGISGIIAVIMLMIGGIQYIISLGGDEVKKAKDRITNALIGMVLLFCATLILFTVNPQLIHLEMPAIPKARTVFFISDTTTCEELLDADYEVEVEVGSGTNCGDPASNVTADSAGNPMEGKTCQWSACPAGKQCLSSTAAGAKGHCVSCLDVVNGNSYDIPVSSSTCNLLTPDDTPTIDYTCFMTEDFSLDSGGIYDGPFCAFVGLACAQITKCSDYENVAVSSKALSSTLQDIQSGSDSDFGLASVCKVNDPCGVGAQTDTVCQFEPDILTNDDCESVTK